jgi:hypothetical protein
MASTNVLDLQTSQLHRLAHRRPLLLPLHVRVGLHAPLPQPQASLLHDHNLQNRRLLWRNQLGNAAIQELGCTVHRFQSAGCAPGCEPLLVVLYLQDRLPLHRVQGCGRRPQRVRAQRGGDGREGKGAEDTEGGD